MPTILYVATGNPGKLHDFAGAAREFGGAVDFLPLPGLANIPPPREDADTFEGNARVKAAEYSLYAAGKIVLADDSGLEVDALHGAPGVRSARYAADAGFAPNADVTTLDDRNNLLLLRNLQNVPREKRTAHYCCVLAAARDGECIGVGYGTVEGIILEVPRGKGGFGYDPLFYMPELDRTMAEIDLQMKLQISHRGHALRDLLRRFPTLIR